MVQRAMSDDASRVERPIELVMAPFFGIHVVVVLKSSEK